MLVAIELKSMVMLGERGIVRTQLAIEESEAGYRIRCFGRDPGAGRGAWIEYAAMNAPYPSAVLPGAGICVEALKKTLKPQALAACYEFWRQRGLHHGPACRGLRALWSGGNQALAHVQMALPETDAQAYRMHPLLLDACFHALSVFCGEMQADALLLPVGVDRLCSYAPCLPTSIWCRITWHGEQSEGRYCADMELYCEAGQLLVSLRGLQLAQIPLPVPAAAIPHAWESRWLPLTLDEWPLRAVPAPNLCWLVYCSDLTAAINLQGECAALGQAAVTIYADTGFKRVDAAIFGFDPHSAQDRERLFATIKAQGVQVRGVLFFDTGDIALRSRAKLPERSDRLVQIAFAVLRNFLATVAGKSPEVVICWRGACPAARPGGVIERMREASLARSVLNGLGRALRAEYPHIKCLQVDLDPLAALPPLQVLLAAVAQLGSMGQIALRGGQWYQAHQPKADSRLPVQSSFRDTPLAHLV